ncbi:MAG: beta-lactamase family protein, partial [Candidatus Krumholzibacteria bacterium]|nr:beta-lactamase family protein [Candidatus Krumholzibacteria bacterium]
MRSLPLLLMLVLSLAGPAAGAGIDDRIPALETYLDRLENLGFAGSVLVAEGDRTLLASGYGLADRATARPWTPQTVSTIGSITKQFTGAAILALSDDGRLSVSDPITKYFSDVPSDKQSITLHQLLTHSSGIMNLEGVGDFDAISRDEFVRRAMAQELAFPPGEGYEYSNAGYSLLGAIIEQLTGASYETFVRERFFLPAGMKDTGYILPDFDMQRVAQGYEGDETWGTVLEHPMADDGPYWVLRANGGIHSTVEDMNRWAQYLLSGKALSPASMKAYWSPQVDEGGGDSFYGYGWVVIDKDGTRIITHNGGNGIFFADMLIVP